MKTYLMPLSVSIFLLFSSACMNDELVLDHAGQLGQAIQATNSPDLTYGVVLIDRTGSMRTTRSATGNTRCYDAIARAESDIDEFFQGGGQGMALWLFSSVHGVEQIGSRYYLSADLAKQALDNLDWEACPSSAMTTLADSLCQVATGQADNEEILVPQPGALYIETDGYENYSSGDCAGPSGAPNQIGTWQEKVFSTLFFGGIKVRTRYWLDEELIRQLGDEDAFDTELNDYPEPVSANSTCVNNHNCEEALFEDLAFWTGGAYGIVDDNSN